MSLKTGHTISPLDPAFEAKLKANTTGFPNGGFVLNPGKFIAPRRLVDNLHHLVDFKVQGSDIFVISFPKTGSTWMQELIWAMTHNPDLDHPQADDGSYSRCPYFTSPIMLEEIPKFLNVDESSEQNLSCYDNLEKPRVFKTHLHFSLMNPDVINRARVIYMIRDPRDTIVSFYHFTRKVKMMAYADTMEEFVDDFLNDLAWPGSYMEHLSQFWPYRYRSNVHTVFYEDLKTDTVKEISKLNSFLQTGLTEQQMKNVHYYTSFSQMKKRDPLENSVEMRADMSLEKSDVFFRKGETGAGKRELSPELWKRVSEYFKTNLYRSGIELPYNFDN